MSVFELFSLKGKKALVTGSSRGIGRAAALALAEAGAHVILHGTHATAQLAEALAEARAFDASAEAVTGDLGSDAELEKLIAAAGAPDIVVLNASVQKYQEAEDFSVADFEAQFKVNVAASFRLIQAFLPAMKAKKWGRFVALGSVNQWKQSPRLPVYAATKAALSNFMQNCARKYGPDGITFNVVAPGVIATDRNREALATPATVEKLLASIPARRFGTPEDCAAAILLLCSDAGSYLTGSDLPVAGGMQL